MQRNQRVYLWEVRLKKRFKLDVRYNDRSKLSFKQSYEIYQHTNNIQFLKQNLDA